MGETSKYLTYVFNIESRKDKSRRSYVSFGDICSKIEFTEACSGKIFTFLRRLHILRIEVEDMEKKC